MPIDDALDEIITAIEADGFDDTAQQVRQAFDALADAQDDDTRLPAWAETLAGQIERAIETTAALHQDGQLLTLDIKPGQSVRWQWTPGETVSADFAAQVIGAVARALGAPVLVLPIRPTGRRYALGQNCGETFGEDEWFHGTALTIELTGADDIGAVDAALVAIGNEGAA